MDKSLQRFGLVAFALISISFSLQAQTVIDHYETVCQGQTGSVCYDDTLFYDDFDDRDISCWTNETEAYTVGFSPQRYITAYINSSTRVDAYSGYSAFERTQGPANYYVLSNSNSPYLYQYMTTFSSPSFTVFDASRTSVSYYICNYGLGYNGYYVDCDGNIVANYPYCSLGQINWNIYNEVAVRYAVNGNAPNIFYRFGVATPWSQQNYDLSSLSSGEAQLQFLQVNRGGMGLGIDNVLVYGPRCVDIPAEVSAADPGSDIVTEIQVSNRKGCGQTTIRIHWHVAEDSDTTTVTANDSYTWDNNGQTYTESGVYAGTPYADANGCTVTPYLDLTIEKPCATTYGTDEQTACDSYTWMDDNTYTESNNTATHTTTNVAGCDSIVHLNLTVNHGDKNSYDATACDSYLWVTDGDKGHGDGTSYNTSGIYYNTYTDANGCAAADTLHLTVNLSTDSTLTVEATGSYTWTLNGQTYSESATDAYTLTGGNAAGCDSVVTLSLTITAAPNCNPGLLPGRFSVSASSQVQFSQGNLQYTAAAYDGYPAGTFRFAENQYDWCGYTYYANNKWTYYGNVYGTYGSNYGSHCANTLMSSTYAGWVDLFGYGTSGWNNQTKGNETRYMPYETYSDRTYNRAHEYYLYGQDMTGAYAQADWGVYNPIVNGGNQAGMWRTLTWDEWHYLVRERPDADQKWGLGQVMNTNGLILLPDDWTLPDGCTFTPRATTYSTANNKYNTAAKWQAMEQAGAVFMPVTGHRDGYGNDAVSSTFATYGLYWTATRKNTAQWAWIVGFYNNMPNPSYSNWTIFQYDPNQNNASYTAYNTHMGLGVRLVRAEGSEGSEGSGQANTRTDVQEACGEYTWIDGVTYTESNNTATFTTTDEQGCELVVTLDLTIIPEPELRLSSHSQTVTEGQAMDEITVTSANATVTVTGLPDGVTYNAATGRIGGTPTAGAGTYNFVVTATPANSVCDAIPLDGAIIIEASAAPEPPATVPCTLPGAFSVSADKQVAFSCGNLQYLAKANGDYGDGTWRFALHQYDFVGGSTTAMDPPGDYGNVYKSDNTTRCINDNVDPEYDGWIDVFCWGTSGWNSGAVKYLPTDYGKTNGTDFMPGGNYANDLTGAYAEADWGVHNAIVNGGNQPGLWRLLTLQEWNYLKGSRANAAQKYGLATITMTDVAGKTVKVYGLVLLPDSWTLPTGCSFTPFNSNKKYSANNYSESQWASMEAAGAVFLPSAGYRGGPAASGIGKSWYRSAYGHAYYQTSTHGTASASRPSASHIMFYGEHYSTRSGDGSVTTSTTTENGRTLAASVRLVRDYEEPTCENTYGTDVHEACSTYTWIDGITYTADNNTAQHTLQNVAGCDSIVTLALTILQSSDSTIEAEACESYTWELNGQTYNASATESETLGSANQYGCDSIVFLSLTIHHGSDSTIEAEACGSYTWEQNGQTYNASATESETLSGANQYGCDSVVTLALTIHHPDTTVYTAAECDSYTWAAAGSAGHGTGEAYTTSGRYHNTYTDANGCTAIDSLILTLTPAHGNYYTHTQCSRYTWPASGEMGHGDGLEHNASATYFGTPYGDETCPSVDTLELTITEPIVTNLEYSVCQDATTVVGRMSQLYYTNFNSASDISDWIIFVGDEEYTLSGWKRTSSDAYDGNSLRVKSPQSSDWQGYDVWGSSFAATPLIYIADPATSEITFQVRAPGVYNSWWRRGSYADGLRLYYTTPDQDIENWLDSQESMYDRQVIWDNDDGATVATRWTLQGTMLSRLPGPGYYRFVFRDYDAWSWASIDEIEVTGPMMIEVPVNVTRDTIIYDTLVAANGCDSIVASTWHVTRGNEYSVTEVGSYTWPTSGAYGNGSGETYTASGNYNGRDYTSGECTVHDVLHLTITETHCVTTYGTDVQVACDSYSWIDGNTYTTDNSTAQYTLTTDAGCDSVVTLNLTINHPDTTVYSAETCLDFTWEADGAYGHGNGETYETSVLIANSYTDANGCTAIDSLRLTITPGAVKDSAVYEDTYVWQGNTYSEERTLARVEGGCDSVHIYFSDTHEPDLPDNIMTIDCSVYPTGDPWTIHNEWSSDNIAANYLTPMVGDLDGDGMPEIVCGGKPVRDYSRATKDSILLVFDGVTKELKATITMPRSVTAFDAGPLGLVKVANGKGLIIVANQDFKLRAYDITAADPNQPYWVSDQPYGANHGDWACNVSFADLNNDGNPEVIVRNKVFDAATGILLATTSGGSNTGSTYAHYTHQSWTGWRLASPCVANLDGDDALEVVLGNEIYKPVITNRTGTAGNSFALWRTITPPSDVPSDGHAQVADFDLDGNLDIFISTRNTDAASGKVGFYVWNLQTNTVSTPMLISTVRSGKSFPLIADIDNDGSLEVVIQCGLTSDAIRSYKYDRSSNQFDLMWTMTPDEDSYSNGVTCFDFNQDGNMELLVCDQSTMKIVNGSGKSHLTGADTVSVYTMSTFAYSEVTIMQYPVIADVDNDGHAEIVSVGSDKLNVFKSDGTPWAPARPVWNQYMYNVTHVNRDLTVPQYLYNNATAFVDPDDASIVRRPFNNFLQQATLLDYHGRPFYGVPNITDVVATASDQAGADYEFSITYSNNGANAIDAPYGITIYKDEFGGEVLMRATVEQPLEAGGSHSITLATPRQPLCDEGVENLVISVNDTNTGVAQNGGQQDECDVTDNIFTLPFTGCCVAEETDITVDTCASSYKWEANGETYTENGSHSVTLTTDEGCDSTVTLHLTFLHGQGAVYEHVACDSYTWADGADNGHGTGETYTTSQRVTGPEYEDANGCAVNDTLQLTINESKETSIDAEACNSYTWEATNEAYTESGSHSASFTTTDGCDSTVTLNLTINESKEESVNAEACDSYAWEASGETYTESGSYSATLSTAAGCDSLVVLTLTINESKETGIEAEACDSYAWEASGETYTESGSYSATLSTAEGNCDSIVVLTLTVNESKTATEEASTCDDSYKWLVNGETYTESGNHSATLSTAAGCDSTVTLNLTIHSARGDIYVAEACDSYTWASDGTDGHGTGETYTTSQRATGPEYEDANGCAVNDTLQLTINESKETGIEAEACDSYTWNANGETYTESGSYSATLSTATGNCDSIVVLTLTVNESKTATEEASTCDDSYKWLVNGETYTESGNHSATLSTAAGCDSTVTLNLTIHSARGDIYVAEACDSYTWASDGTDGHGTGETYTTSQRATGPEYEDANGCAVNDTLQLTINESKETSIEAEACDSYTWNANGETYTESGSYSATLSTAEGNCDSIVVLTLTVNESKETGIDDEACDSYTWNADGETYTESGSHSTTLATTAGCDSLVTLNLTIKSSYESTEDVSVCRDSYKWNVNGLTYNESGSHRARFTASNGCDSSIYLNLTLTSGHGNRYETSACDSYTWAADGTDGHGTGEAYTASQLLIGPEYTNDGGCDVRDTLQLTIGLSTESSEEIAVCGSYTWPADGQTYSASGSHSTTLRNAEGCDSIVTLNLTILTGSGQTYAKTVCDSYTWDGSDGTGHGTGLTYDESQQVVGPTYAAEGGCTVADTLQLTITSSIETSEEAVACGSYKWIVNGETYTESGSHSATFRGANGCDSIVILNLTISNGQGRKLTIAACDSYTWNGADGTGHGTGETYYTSQQAVGPEYVDEGGCPVNDTLQLTISTSTESGVDAEACGSYTWAANDETYNENGSYSVTLTTAKGCDSTLILNLTIHPSYNDTLFVNTCASYTWNGTVYDADGLYVSEGVTAFGCDSVKALSLLITDTLFQTLTTAFCDSSVWEGVTYTDSYSIVVEDVDFQGCPVIYTVMHTYHASSTPTTNAVEACDSYFWEENHTRYNTSTVATARLVNAEGCDSAATLNIVIRQGDSTGYNEVATDLFHWSVNDSTYTATTFDRVVYQNAEGCDSVITLSITILNGNDVATVIDSVICGTEYRNETTYDTTHLADYDSIVITNYRYRLKYDDTLVLTSYVPLTLDGQTIETSGVYHADMRSSQGCDSLVTLDVTILPPPVVMIDSLLCAYEDRDTVVIDTVHFDGYDSVAIIHLKIRPTYYSEKDSIVSAPIMWGGTERTVSGTYADSLTTAEGCDSVRVLHLTMRRYGMSDSLICSDSYSDTLLMDTLHMEGYDSIMAIRLHVRPTYSVSDDTTVVAMLYWNGDYYFDDTTVTDTLRTIDGCDSIVTLTITIDNGSDTVVLIDDTICTTDRNDTVLLIYTSMGDYDSITILRQHSRETYNIVIDSVSPVPIVWHGTTLTESDTYTASLVSIDGCDSTITLNFTLDDGSGNVVVNLDSLVCGTALRDTALRDTVHLETYDSITIVNLHYRLNYSATIDSTVAGSAMWGGIERTEDGLYADSLTTADGCDSVMWLNLTVRGLEVIDTTVIACDTYTWPITGQTYTVSDDIDTLYVAADGTDSLMRRLHLTVIYSDSPAEVDITACGSYTWPDNGETYTASATLTTTNACGNEVSLSLTVNPSYNDSLFMNVCDSYEWDGVLLDTNGFYTNAYTTAQGCDSVVTIELLITDTLFITLSTSFCDSAIYNGITYTDDFTIVVDSIAGNCPAVYTVHYRHATSSPVTETNETVCDSYTWPANGQTYYADREAEARLTNADGCDSVVRLALTVNHGSVTRYTEMAHDSYYWPLLDSTYTSTTEDTLALSSANGCDSLHILNITILGDNEVAAIIDTTLCGTRLFDSVARSTVSLQDYDSITIANLHYRLNYVSTLDSSAEAPALWRGNEYSVSGQYADSLTTADGCDSVFVLNLTIIDHSEPVCATTYGTLTIASAACDGTAIYDDRTYTSDTSFTDTLTNMAGCDSLLAVSISITSVVQSEMTLEGCDTVQWRGHTYHASADTIIMLGTAAAGCDSVEHLTVTVNPSYETTESVVACQSYQLNDSTYQRSTTVYYNGATVAGCDSVAALYINIVTSGVTDSVLVACDSLRWHDSIYRSSTVDTFAFNVEACSGMQILNLTLGHSSITSSHIDFCDSIVWLDTIYHTSQTLATTAVTAEGCDSIANTELVLHPSETSALVAFTCDSYVWNDSTYTQSTDTDSVRLSSVYGCDSIVFLNLVIEHSVVQADTILACPGYIYGGVAYYESTPLQVDSATAANGCDSLTALYLQIGDYGQSLEEALTACDHYTWRDDVTYLTDTIVTKTLPDSNGCSNTYQLTLTIHYSEYSVDEVSTCQSYVWHNNTYSTSATDTVLTGTTEAGCGQYDVLALTVGSTAVHVLDTLVCDYLTLPDGTTVSSPVTDFDIPAGTAANGCDSLLRLTLRIGGVEHESDLTACERFEYKGIIYSHSQQIREVFSLANGCDSISLLNLNIASAKRSNTPITACESYTWRDGSVYYENTVLTETLRSAEGCDSIVSVILTIEHNVQNDVSVSQNVPYEWNGTTYDATGDYVQHLSTAAGCDSVVTLHFTYLTGDSPVLLLHGERLLLVNHYPNGEDYPRVDYSGYRWYRNGELIADAYSDAYFVELDKKLQGCYYVEVLSGGNWLRSNTICVGVTGIGDVTLDQARIAVYPNPAPQNGEAVVSTNLSEGQLSGARLLLTDMQGRTLQSISSPKQLTLLTLHLAKGVYVVQLRTAEGWRLSTKLVVE